MGAITSSPQLEMAFDRGVVRSNVIVENDGFELKHWVISTEHSIEVSKDGNLFGKRLGVMAP